MVGSQRGSGEEAEAEPGFVGRGGLRRRWRGSILGAGTAWKRKEEEAECGRKTHLGEEENPLRVDCGSQMSIPIGFQWIALFVN